MWKRVEKWIHAYEPLLFILILIAALRLPSLFEPYWYGDEAIYLTIGQALHRGSQLYKDIFDHKPPIIYWLSAAVNGNLFAFKLVTMIVNLLTIVGFYKLLTKLEVKKYALPLLIFGLLTTLPLIEGNIANAELLFLLPVVFAFYLGMDTNRKRSVFISGVLLGIATLIKVPAIFEAVVLGLFWAITGRKHWFRNGILLGLGIALPIAASFGYYFLLGIPGDYLRYAWTYNLGYSDTWKPDASLASSMVVKAGVVAAWIAAVFMARKKLTPVALLASLWIPISLFAALLSNRPYPHYLVQVVTGASLAVWVWQYFERKLDRWFATGALALTVLVVYIYGFSFYPTVGYYKNYLSWLTRQQTQTQYFNWFNSATERNYAVAKILMLGSSREEKVFVWGDEPVLYALSKRSPATKYTTRFHILSLNTEEEVITELQQNPPRYLVTTDDNVPAQLAKLIEDRYLLEKQVDQVAIYRRLLSYN